MKAFESSSGTRFWTDPISAEGRGTSRCSSDPISGNVSVRSGPSALTRSTVALISELTNRRLTSGIAPVCFRLVRGSHQRSDGHCLEDHRLLERWQCRLQNHQVLSGGCHRGNYSWEAVTSTLLSAYTEVKSFVFVAQMLRLGHRF